MKHRYHISPQGRGPELTDAELLRYRDQGKLHYNYQRALSAMHRKPLYKDPKAFVALLLIVAMAWFIREVADRQPPPAPQQSPATTPR